MVLPPPLDDAISQGLVFNNDKLPRLHVKAGGSPACRLDYFFHVIIGDWVGLKAADSTPVFDKIQKVNVVHGSLLRQECLLNYRRKEALFQFILGESATK